MKLVIYTNPNDTPERARDIQELSEEAQRADIEVELRECTLTFENDADAARLFYRVSLPDQLPAMCMFHLTLERASLMCQGIWIGRLIEPDVGKPFLDANGEWVHDRKKSSFPYSR